MAKNKIKEVQEVQEDKMILVIDIPFTDKHTAKEYKVNDEITFEKERAEELLRDTRNLVHKK